MTTELARAGTWLLCHDTGASSTALLARMLGASPDEATFRHPHDPSDFGRCHRLLESVPEWRTRLPEMAACSAYWAALVDRWDEITALLALDRKACHALMRSILNPIEDADQSIIRLGKDVTMRWS